MRIKASVFAVSLLGALATAQLAQAQTAAPAEAPAAAASPYSDADLKSFAVALGSIQKLSQEYGARLATAKDPSAKEFLQREMATKMNEAVTSSGISAQKYNEISTAIRTDEALRQRVGEAMAPAA